jgi:hypothetical protein
MDICYKVLKEQLKDESSTIKEIDLNRLYGIVNNGGRPCGEDSHGRNGGYLRLLDSGQVEYRCHSQRCKGKVLTFDVPELKPFTAGPRCLPPGTLDKFNRLEGKIFLPINQYYYQKMKEKKLENGITIDSKDKELLQFAQGLRDAWREDNHAVINHFFRRNTTKEFIYAELQWEITPYGFRRRVVQTLKGDAEIRAQFHDKFITLCTLKKETKKKDPIWTFECVEVSIYQHLCGTRKDQMKDTEKITISGLEFFPAFPDQDPRTEWQKGNRLNTWGGEDIPPRRLPESGMPNCRRKTKTGWKRRSNSSKTIYST